MRPKLIFLTSIALLISIILPAQLFAAVELSDIAGHKNQTAIQFLVDKNIINGNPDKTYRPDTGVNRAETLKLLFEAKGGQGLEEPTEQCFPDVPLNEWFTIYVCSAKKLGRIEGYPDGMFHPERDVNKVEFIKMIAEFAGWNLTEGEGATLFADTDENAWYAGYLKYAKMKELIEYSGDNYEPGEPMFRGSVAETIFRSALVKYMQTGKFKSSDISTYLDEMSGEDKAPDIGGDISLPVTDTTDDTSGGDQNSEPPALDQNSALTIVKNALVIGHSQESKVAVYSPSATLKVDDQLSYYDLDNNGQTVTLDKEVWFFWVDYYPTAPFFHETKLATVDMEGSLESYESEAYPFINGTPKYKVDTERLPSADLIHVGDDTETELKDLLRLLTEDDPQFGACAVPADSNKRALVAYFGEDKFIKRNAVNMYDYFCAHNYVTKIATGDTSEEGYNDIALKLAEIEDESHTTGFSSVAFHVSSHGMRNTGNLFIGDTITVIQGDRIAINIIQPDYIDLDDLAALWGTVGFQIGTEGIWTDSFHIMHDTCYSGNAVAKYQSEAYIPGSRESAVGWIATSSASNEVSYATNLVKYGQYFTKAITTCMESHVPYSNVVECIKGQTTELVFSGAPTVPQTPQFEKLSPITDDSTPFLP